MWSADEALKRARGLQERLLLQEDLQPPLGKTIRAIRGQLLEAYKAGLLVGDERHLYQSLKSEPPNRDGHTLIAGGRRFDGAFDSWEGLDRWDAFTRDDGARFGFILTYAEERVGLRPIAYSFTFVFPKRPGLGVSAVRWDLDRAGAGHSDEGLRSHLHVHSNLRLPAPQLRAIDFLDLFVHRLGR